MRRLADDTLVVFLSDCHIGGDPGRDIFESPDELASLLDELDAHPGPVELVLAGDFFDLLRVARVPDGGNRASATTARPEYRALFDGLRRFAAGGSRTVIYLPGNHDAEVWWNPDIRDTLEREGLVNEFALSYTACFESEPDRLIYCEHGNQFDPANTFRDYADPLDTPLGDHVVTDLMPRLPGGRTLTPTLHLREIDRIFPLTEIPEWIAGRLFYDLVRQAVRWLLLPLLVAYAIYGVIKVAFGGYDDGVVDVLVDVGYDVLVLLVAFGLFVLVLRRTANQVIRGAARRFGDHRDPERERTGHAEDDRVGAGEGVRFEDRGAKRAHVSRERAGATDSIAGIHVRLIGGAIDLVSLRSSCERICRAYRRRNSQHKSCDHEPSPRAATTGHCCAAPVAGGHECSALRHRARGPGHGGGGLSHGAGRGGHRARCCGRGGVGRHSSARFVARRWCGRGGPKSADAQQYGDSGQQHPKGRRADDQKLAVLTQQPVCGCEATDSKQQKGQRYAGHDLSSSGARMGRPKSRPRASFSLHAKNLPPRQQFAKPPPGALKTDQANMRGSLSKTGRSAPTRGPAELPVFPHDSAVGEAGPAGSHRAGGRRRRRRRSSSMSDRGFPTGVVLRYEKGTDQRVTDKTRGCR